MGLPVKEVVEIKGTPEREKIKKASPMTPNTTSILASFGAGGLPTAHWSVCTCGVLGVASCRWVTYRG